MDQQEREKLGYRLWHVLDQSMRPVDVQAAMDLIKQGADLEVKIMNRTPLDMAVDRKWEEKIGIALAIIEASPKMDKDYAGNAFVLTLLFGNAIVMDALIQAGLPVDDCSRYNNWITGETQNIVDYIKAQDAEYARADRPNMERQFQMSLMKKKVGGLKPMDIAEIESKLTDVSAKEAFRKVCGIEKSWMAMEREDKVMLVSDHLSPQIPKEEDVVCAPWFWSFGPPVKEAFNQRVLRVYDCLKKTAEHNGVIVSEEIAANGACTRQTYRFDKQKDDFVKI